MPLFVPPRIDPYQRGQRMGEQFITERAGWTADRIIATFGYVTGPLRDRANHTPAQRDWFRGFTEPITRHLAQEHATELCFVLRSSSADQNQTGGGTL